METNQMNPSQLSRWSTLALMGGGVFLALFTSTHPAGEAQPSTANQTQWILAHSFHWVGAFLLLFGLMGLGTRLLPRGGRLGLIAFMMAFTGTAFFFAGGVVSAYIDPLLPVTALISSGAAPAPLVPYIAFVGISAICLVFGWALIGVALERAELLAFAPAAALAIASFFLLLPPPQVGPVLLHAVQGVVFGAALIWVGLELRRGPVLQQGTASAAG
jgi:hypothetical protein